MTGQDDCQFGKVFAAFLLKFFTVTYSPFLRFFVREQSDKKYCILTALLRSDHVESINSTPARSQSQLRAGQSTIDASPPGPRRCPLLALWHMPTVPRSSGEFGVGEKHDIPRTCFDYE